MRSSLLARALKWAPALLLAGAAACGAGGVSPAPKEAQSETPASRGITGDDAETLEIKPDGAPTPPSSELLRAIETASDRRDAAAAGATTEDSPGKAGLAQPTPNSLTDSEEGRPVSSGSCVGRPSKVARRKINSKASCCYTPPTYFRNKIQTKNEAFRACYKEALARRPDVHGRILSKFTIEEDGSVIGACDGGSTVADPALVACVLRVFTAVTFDAYTAGDPCPPVTLIYPLHFTPEPPTK